MDCNLRNFTTFFPRTRFLEMQFTVNRKMISNAWISNLYTSHQTVIQLHHRSSYDEVKCMTLCMGRSLNMLLKTKPSNISTNRLACLLSRSSRRKLKSPAINKSPDHPARMCSRSRENSSYKSALLITFIRRAINAENSHSFGTLEGNIHQLK